jgi:DNA-binding CsgD family transcriptional regulator
MDLTGEVALASAVQEIPKLRATGRGAESALRTSGMTEAEIASNLVGDIYDAALDPAMWIGVLAKIADFTGARAGALAVKDRASAGVEARYQFGIDPNDMQTYSETYSQFDPLKGVPLFGVGEIVSLPDLVPYEEYRGGRFYQEWARPQGWIDVASAVLEKSLTGCAFLGIVRDKAGGMVDDEMRRRIAGIVPHVRRAIVIGKATHFKYAEAAALAETLDGLSAGMFLVDARGRIIHSNVAGRVILDAADFLRSTRGQLVAADAQVNQTLREVFAIAGQGNAAHGVKGIALPLTAHDGEHYVAHVLPLSSGARLGAGITYAAAAAVFVRKATLETPPLPEVIRRTFKLTPMELRVLIAVVEVGGVPQVATVLGVADTTVKTHVSRLFEKTGARRQADLVRLVAGFSTPLAV